MWELKWSQSKFSIFKNDAYQNLLFIVTHLFSNFFFFFFFQLVGYLILLFLWGEYDWVVLYLRDGASFIGSSLFDQPMHIIKNVNLDPLISSKLVPFELLLEITLFIFIFNKSTMILTQSLLVSVHFREVLKLI